MDDTTESGPQARNWLLLIHQIPAEPAYLRVKVSRRLKAIGAAALKNSVYVLPDTADRREDFRWVLGEVVQGGGEATVASVRWVAGMTDGEIEALLEADRAAEYGELAAEATSLESPTAADLQRLQRRLGEIVARDHVGSGARAVAESALARLGSRLRGEPEVQAATRLALPSGATWVTRRGVFVDRMASAWLIRRFIDGSARFRYLADGEEPAAGEEAFDLFGVGHTHEGDRCTFETLLARFGPEDAALRAIAEVVHDIDCRDDRFGRPETPGVEALLRGIVRVHAEDEARVSAGAAVWDGLYAHFRAGGT